MILGSLFCMAAVQILAYALVSKFRFGKLTVLAMLLISNLFLLPHFFMPEYGPNDTRCGLPILATYLSFWIFGNALVLGVHLSHWLYRKWSRK